MRAFFACYSDCVGILAILLATVIMSFFLLSCYSDSMVTVAIVFASVIVWLFLQFCLL